MEKEGLLDKQIGESDLESSTSLCCEVQEQQRNRHGISALTKLGSISLTLNVALSIVCICLATYIQIHIPDHRTCESQAGIYSSSDLVSPASSAVKLVLQDPWRIDSNYSGAPGSNYSAIWSDLLEGTLLNVTVEEIQHNGERASVKYETGGYAAGLGVGHDLHCLKRLKDFVWLEELHPDVRRDNSTEYQMLREHADHCVDTIRQQILCHPDVELYPLEYVEHSRISGKPTLSKITQRKCVDFGRLQEWMKSRSGNAELFVKPPWL